MFALRKSAAVAAVLLVGMVPSGCGSSGTTTDEANGNTEPVTTGGPLVAGGAASMFVVQNNTTAGNNFNASAADNVLQFSISSSSGVVTPASAFSGPAGIFIAGVTTDAAGNIYAAGTDSAGVGQILVYPAGSAGNATASRVIAGATTGLFNVEGIAVDSAGQIYVTVLRGIGASNNAVLVFAANATGNTAPVRTISGGLTGLYDPAGIAVDTTGTIYVADYTQNRVEAFNTAATGNVLPTRSFTTAGPPVQIALDSANNIYLSLYNATGAYGAINVFAPTATGTLPNPTRVVGGSALGAYGVLGAAIDSKNNLYTVFITRASSGYNYGLAGFSPTATGNATPAFTNTSTAYTYSEFGYIAVR